MLRLILWNLLMFSLPFLVSLIWLALFKRVKPAEADYKIWAFSAVAGLVLLFASLLSLRGSLDVAPSENYIPPHMQDGDLIPGHFKPRLKLDK